MSSEAVKVMVRVRPMSESEKLRQCKSIIDIHEKTKSLTLHKKDDPDGSKQFTFDFVFSPATSQQFIYEQTAFPLVESVVEGYNGTIFAYGQTGCGKTFSMIGDPLSEVQKGIIPRAFQHIVKIISTCTTNNKYLIRCSYLEIYNEEIHDLIGRDVKARMEMKESFDKGVFIKDLNQVVVKSVEDMEKLMNYGNKNRAVGETQMNKVLLIILEKDSSRSHSVFTVYVECGEGNSEDSRLTAGKLHLVDLAGSERQSKTQATGDRLKEGAKINLSLSALGNVISALVDGKTAHIPYRDSKLTRLLMDSLGGNTKTIMIAAASPADYNFEETLSTLRYASRAKFIQNKPKVNEDPKDALLKEYADEIRKLKELLSQTQQPKPPLPNGKPTASKGQAASKASLRNSEECSPVKQQKTQLELQKLQEVNSKLSKQQEIWETQIKEKEEKVLQEKQQREKLENLIKEIEQKAITGGQANEEEKKKFRKLQTQLKKQIKEQEKLQDEKKQKEDELVFLEKNYQSLQEEVDSLRNIVIRLRNRYKQALEEISDLQREHEENREDLLDTIRFQEKEVKLYRGIARMLLNSDELFNVKSQCQWNADKNDYLIVPFYLKEKELKFPKLPYQQALDLIDNEKEVRTVMFKQPNKLKTNSVDNHERSEVMQTFKDSNLSYASKPSLQERRVQNTKLQPLNYENESQVGQSMSTSAMKKKKKLNPLLSSYQSDQNLLKLQSEVDTAE